MKKQLTIVLVSITLLFTVLSASAQQPYWKPTDNTPTTLVDNGNTCIAINNNDILFVGTLNSGIYKSTDGGKTWLKSLNLKDIPVIKIICEKEFEMYAIAGSTVYYSNNAGDTWISNLVPTKFPLTDIELVGRTKILVSTASIIDTAPGVYEYYGDGIFESENFGKNWVAKNRGLQHNLAITNLAISSTNVWIASMAGFKEGFGGLYYSLNEGEEWINLSFPKFYGLKSNVLYKTQSMYEIHCLEFDKNDYLYVSFDGSGGNFSIQGGFYIHLNDALIDEEWSALQINSTGFEWQFHPFHSIYFAKQREHIYASLNTISSVSFGGNYIKDEFGKLFKRKVFGVQPVRESYLKMLYTEDSKGRIFAVQYLDHRVYFTDSSTVTKTGFNNDYHNEIGIYPNPSTSFVNIKTPLTEEKIISVKLFDIHGQLIQEEAELPNNQFVFDINKQIIGLYLINIQTNKSNYSKMISIQ